MPTTTAAISAGTPTKGAAARTARVPGVTGRPYALPAICYAAGPEPWQRRSG